MTEPEDAEPAARLRPHRWVAWVWVVPILAAAVVLWLAWHSLAGRGPEIAISFSVARGLEAGQSTIQHRSVVVGVVESLELTPDMSRVIVHARMKRSVEPSLTETAAFYIVAPRVTAEGISGLSTLVSGTYIELAPGKPGKSKREFEGLNDPPAMQPDSPGRSFQLTTDDLGSLTRGSKITFRGVPVGEVTSYVLDSSGERINVTAFIRAPYDRLVHPETRFWNAGGVDVAVGAQGVRIRANSWTQLLSGGISFETPGAAPKSASSDAGATFPLYDNRRRAMRDPSAEELLYVADFTGNLRGVDAGTAVELEGNEVGEVREAHLKYDPVRKTLVNLVTISIDPSRVEILDMPRPADANQRQVVTQWFETLVANGLRAQVTTTSFLTGVKIIALDMVKGAAPARLEKVGNYVRMPSVPSGDLGDVLQSLRAVLKNVDRATAGPELGHAIQSLDATLTNLDNVTKDVGPDLKSLVQSLRETADAAQSTLNSARGMMGTGEPGGTDLPRLIRELTEAARSVRGLADYLDRHPEALLRGRAKDGNEK